MNDRRGFTLVELLSAIIVIGLLMVVIARSLRTLDHHHQQSAAADLLATHGQELSRLLWQDVWQAKTLEVRSATEVELVTTSSRVRWHVDAESQRLVRGDGESERAFLVPGAVGFERGDVGLRLLVGDAFVELPALAEVSR